MFAENSTIHMERLQNQWRYFIST